MNFLKFAVIFFIFYAISDWILKKIGLYSKILQLSCKHKHCKTILIVSVLLILLLFEIAKSFLNERFGHPNYVSLIVGALISPLYVNVGLLMFERNKQ